MGKYSFEKIEDNKSYVWHTDGENKTLIAITDNTEKAHFLATAANAYKEPIEESEQNELWENLQDIINDHFNGDSLISSACIELLSSKYILIKR